MAEPLPRHLLPDTAEIGPDGNTAVGGCDLVDLANRWGTPLFVYDEDHLRSRCREAVAAFGGGVAYASKAFLCSAMAPLARSKRVGRLVPQGARHHRCPSGEGQSCGFPSHHP